MAAAELERFAGPLYTLLTAVEGVEEVKWAARARGGEV